MKKKLFLVPLFAVLLITVFALGFSINKNSPSNGFGNSNIIEYNSMVCIQTTGDFEGRKTPVGEYENVGCSHNVLYDTGKEAIEDYLMEGTGGNDAFDWIELCNSSTNQCGEPVAGKTEAYSAHTTCGLSNVAGTAGTNAASGNWTIYHEFTCSCDNTKTNMSRLRNDDDDDLAGNNFTAVTLQTNDKLNVTWDVWVT